MEQERCQGIAEATFSFGASVSHSHDPHIVVERGYLAGLIIAFKCDRYGVEIDLNPHGQVMVYPIASGVNWYYRNT